MSRVICIGALLLVTSCSADPVPPISRGTGEHETAVGTAPTPPKRDETAAAPASASAKPVPHEATDPAALLGGGAALDALPTRATETGGQVDPGLRQRLMEPLL